MNERVRASSWSRSSAATSAAIRSWARSAGIVVGGERPAADRDESRAEALDEREQLGPGLLGDDLAEQRTEEADLPGERVAGAADARAGGLGGDGGETRRSPTAAPRRGSRGGPERRQRDVADLGAA